MKNKYLAERQKMGKKFDQEIKDVKISHEKEEWDLKISQCFLS